MVFDHSDPPKVQSGAGRVAIVTGSSRGIGAATARRLDLDGYAVSGKLSYE